MKTKEELLYNLRMFTIIGWDIPDDWFRYIVIDCKPINWWGWERAEYIFEITDNIYDLERELLKTLGERYGIEDIHLTTEKFALETEPTISEQKFYNYPDNTVFYVSYVKYKGVWRPCSCLD
tara:strand:+ start:329 stop:694 length:366 start_codon:yes stop_codon:yes gene_type:complete